jgi:riboflavin biosynthesis pyrimidine reductase
VRLVITPPQLTRAVPPEFEPTEVGVLDRLYGAERPALPDRPWVGVCMIASLDGTTSQDGVSGGLGNDADRAVFGALRRSADAILVGAATARADRYGAPKRAGQRIGVVTARGSVDTSSELFGSGAGFLVMPEDGPDAPPGIDVVRAGRGRVDVAVALRRLGDVIDPPRFVQLEGGPRLNASLLDADCFDELNLSVAPVVVGGLGQRIVAGAVETTRRLDLVHLLVDGDGYLFGRWVRRTP